MTSRVATKTMSAVAILATSASLVALPVAAQGASMMASHKWTGTVAKVDAMRGKTDSFHLTVGTHHYVVDYTSKVKYVMGMSTGIVPGAKVTVTGTLKGSTITATSLSI